MHATREDKLIRAAAVVNEGKYTLREASIKYFIPKSMLWDKVSGKVAFGTVSGPERYLNDTEEEQLVKFLIGAAKIGFPRSKKQVLIVVRVTLAKNEVVVLTKFALLQVGGLYLRKGTHC